MTTAPTSAPAASDPLLVVNGIEVIYNHVILVLKGVSLQVPRESIVAILGGNGAGKTTTLRAISNLLKGERGEVTKGTIELEGERIESLTPSELVQRGVVQVMEGRHCFAHLTIEENLMTGSYTRTDKGEIAANLEKVYNYFPRLKTRRTSQAAYTSGGEQQMCAIGRALMANPRMVLLDEPSMGLAPQIVEEVFNIVRDLNSKEKVTFLLAEQNTNMALKYSDYGYIMESGRIVMDGAASDLASNEDVKEFYLGVGGGERKSFKDVKSYCIGNGRGWALLDPDAGTLALLSGQSQVRPASACDVGKGGEQVLDRASGRPALMFGVELVHCTASGSQCLMRGSYYEGPGNTQSNLYNASQRGGSWQAVMALRGPAP